MPKTPFDLIALFPYVRTRGRCRIRGIEFRDIDDLDGLEEPVRSHARTLGGMFYTCQGGRIAKPMFAAITIHDGEALAVAHRALIEAQLLITYIYGAPHSSPTATDDVFLSSECSTLFTFTPDRIVSGLARLTKSDAESGRIADDDAESLPSSDFIEGYEGLRNQVVPLWVAEGSRIYPELPNICLNYSQYLDAHLEQFLSAAKNWPFRYVFERNDLSHDNQERVFSSLLWYSRSCRTSADPTERLLFLAIALETLLALAKGERLTERFKEAVVTLVGPVPRLDEWLNQFYAARSTTVHKGSPAQLFFKANPVHATLPHRALIVYGRRVFRICMIAVLTGALLTEESQIASLLIHNNERLDEICKQLATADRSALGRLLAVGQQVEELHECETITLLRLEENLDKLYGAARLLLKAYSDCKQIQNSEVDSALSAVVSSDRSTKARDVHDQLHKLTELLRHEVRVERKPNPTPPPPLSLSEDLRAHYSIEQQTLGAEKNDLIKSVESDRTFAIVASGAVWAWFATNPLQGSLRAFYLLPLGLSLLFVLKRLAANTAIDQIGKYVRNMENRLILDQSTVQDEFIFGWEMWLIKNRSEWFRRYDFVFWMAVCIGNILIAWALWLRP